MKSEYKNFLLNVVYQVLTYIFPLITVPYVSRILGVDNIGIYSYTFSIVSMFLLFGMLGLNNYGNREIAKVRDNREKTSKCFLSIYTLQLFVNIISIAIYLVYIHFFCNQYLLIAKLQLIYLVSMLFDVNWFYFGLEKFKMTITRNLIIKICSIILIFTLVKSRSDLWLYTIIIGSSTLISQLYLFFNLKRIIIPIKFTITEVKSHIKSIMLLFIPVLAYSIYRVMDKIMIGSISSVTELGNYENAERLISIPISIITALGTVMLPRMSYLLANQNSDFKKTIYNSMQLILILATIMAFGLFIISNEISTIMFGKEFTKSGIIIRIIAITIIISAWANVIRTQYIIPKGLDSIYIKSTIGGAIINLFSNLIFIKLYGAIGACIGTILAETYVMLYQSYMCRTDLELKKYLNLLIKYSYHSFFIVLVAYILSINIDNIFIKVIIKLSISIILFLFIEKDFIVYNFFGKKRKS